MEQADGSAPGDENRVPEMDVDLVLTAQDAGQRFDEDCGATGARVVESDQVAAFHSSGGHDHEFGEPSVEGDADSFRGRAQVLVAPNALGARSTADVGCDENQVAHGEPAGQGPALAYLGDAPDDLMTGHTSNTIRVCGVFALEDADVRAADPRALHCYSNVARLERWVINVLNDEIAGPAVDDCVHGQAPGFPAACHDGTKDGAATSVRRTVRFSRMESVPAKTSATARVPLTAPTRTGAPSIAATNSTISLTYASAKRSRHERNTASPR